MTDTDRLRELDKAATPAPERPYRTEAGDTLIIYASDHGFAPADERQVRYSVADIEAEALPALLDELDALRAVAEAARPFNRSPAEYAGTFSWEERAALRDALRRLDQQGGEK